MILSTLLKNIPIQANHTGDLNALTITGLSLDSRTIKPGDLFIALPGTQSDGRHYISQAISNGAVAILYETDKFHPPSYPMVPVLGIQHLYKYLAQIACLFYQNPSKKMKMLGVTGTNGKTTCAEAIAQLLQLLNINCGLIGTLGFGFPPHLTPNANTTPDAITLQHQLSLLLKGGASSVAMEVSSHALHQKRTQGIEFDVGIFTNLTHDHLDYHGTMEQYWAAKQILFKDDTLKQAIINLDDPHGLELVYALKGKLPLVGYTLQENKDQNFPDLPIIRAHHIRPSPKGIQAKVTSPFGEGYLKSTLLGRFNVSNLLAVLGAIHALFPSIEFETLLAHLSKIKTIPGRMQAVGGKKQPLVVIDYAHTPDALKQALIALREHTQGKLWCVFGCGGNRDQAKRPLMGQVAEQYSDQLIITDDNPRNENPKDIIQQIISGLSCPWAAEIEHDRKVAIAHAVECAKMGDIILIAGKGHEHYQYILDKKIEFNDFDQAKLALRAKELAQL